MISPRWIGLANYQERLTGDEPSPKALRNTSVYTALYVPPHALTALGVSQLRHEIQRGTGGVPHVFFLAAIFPAVAPAYLWILNLNPNNGLGNRGPH